MKIKKIKFIKNLKGPTDIIPTAKALDLFTQKRSLLKSNSDILNPYTQNFINNYKRFYFALNTFSNCTILSIFVGNNQVVTDIFFSTQIDKSDE